MLQQTQVKTVIPYFIKFVNKIPNLKVLSKSKEKKVLKLWEGLGYYKRAKNLLKTAKILMKNHNGKIPQKFEEIKKLPGIGEYTANALLAIIHNKSRIAIDGNVKRVFSRIFLINIKNNDFGEEIKKMFNKFFHTNRNADLVEALMEFGSKVCKPHNPLCHSCNLRRLCGFYKIKKNILLKKKVPFEEKKFNIYCYLNRHKKEMALTKNNSVSFLRNFNIPKIKMTISNNDLKIKKWNYLCNYKKNISNIKMNISLFYKFTKNKPEKFKWYSIDKPNKEFIPSFTKNIFQKVEKLYL